MAHSSHTRFAQRVRRRHAAELHLLPPGAPDVAAMGQAYLALLESALRPDQALRVLRQLVLERLLTLDCDEGTPLSQITGCMTALAELALDVACTQASLTLDAQHGMPTTAQGQRARLWIVGMGKLGARELNVSSDIDLIYVYEQDGETTGDVDGLGRISNQEYFAKVVRVIHGLVGEVTDHGFVFRLDLALRPNGNAGPSAISLSALEEYFHVQGREWERFAWLKSRVVAPVQNMHDGSGQALRSLVMPFVFRRYLDYSVFDALRVLHRQIREHANRRSAGRPERHNDVKLSRGGIREIEFTVQLLQVVRGGQYPELRTRPTLSALQRLARAGLMPGPTAEALAQAYVFLRQVEHRIQYLDDLQTHVLPHHDGDLDWIARSLGFDTSGMFLTQLDMHREVVAYEFDQLLGAASASDCKGCGAPSAPDLDALLTQLPAQFAERVTLWREHPRVLALSDASRGRLLRLLARTAQWLREGRVNEASAVRLADWMEPLLRRENYLALLLERPQVHERLMRLLGAARWPARYLQLHPGVIDELAVDTMVHERFAADEFETELEHRRLALRAAGEDDDEALLNLLRRAHHAEVFRTLARDLEGTITVEQVADDLSALADAVLRVTTRWCWDRLKKKHRPDPQLAIIAYGKLGGKELGYGSDLDLVFVFDDDDEQAPEVYATLVRKLIHWLTLKTGQGDLYEIDTALRPNGSSGLLITSFTSYANYQQQRGANTAWTWEHQAMTRARCVLGSAALRERFDTVRQAVVMTRREPLALRQEIMAMRDKVRAAHPVRGEAFDVKHSIGGMVDVEFAVQFLVLSQAADHPKLSANMGNIALLQLTQAEDLLPDGVGEAAAVAYRELRRVQHRARLDEVPTQVEQLTVQSERQAVLALWDAVFNKVT
jgi:[glutamine synthetase] adenylyltransferase / [glutamine synthetase]-adenylyl-L-tyrosine phosphorylase